MLAAYKIVLYVFSPTLCCFLSLPLAGCFFYDDSLSYKSPATTRTSMYSSSTEPMRRKVVQYIAHADQTDTIAGHGRELTCTYN